VASRGIVLSRLHQVIRVSRVTDRVPSFDSSEVARERSAVRDPEVPPCPLHPHRQYNAGTLGTPTAEHRGWTTGRVVTLVAGCVLGLFSLGLLAGGGWATWMTNTQRDSAGYLTASPHVLSTSGHVISSKEVAELAAGPYRSWLGTVRVRVTPTNTAAQIFVGVAPTTVVDSYLTGVDRTVVTGWFPFKTEQATATGAAPKTQPGAATFWTAHVAGTGTQTLSWKPSSDSTVVVMNADGSAGVSARADIGATVPDLAWLAVGLFVIGGLLLGGAVALVAIPVVRASR
jgi:hypothetical protein